MKHTEKMKHRRQNHLPRKRTFLAAAVLSLFGFVSPLLSPLSPLSPIFSPLDFTSVCMADDITLAGNYTDPISFDGSTTVVSSAGDFTSSGNVTFTSNGTFNVTSGTLTQTGTVHGGSFTLTKTGAGTLDLANIQSGVPSPSPNTFYGTMAVEQGTLKISGGTDAYGNPNGISFIVGNPNSNGTARLILGGGYRPVYTNQTPTTIYPNGELTIAVPDISLAWNQTLTFAGGGKITSENADSYFNFRGGSQRILLTGDNATASIDANMYLYEGSGTITVNSSSSTLTINSSITDGGRNLGILKTGEGKLELKAANSYNGGTTINGGTVTATNRNSLGSGTVNIGENGTLLWNVSSGDNAQVQIPNTLTGTGNLYLLNNINYLTDNTTGKALNTYMSDFHGTITAGKNTRLRIDRTSDLAIINGLKSIVVENNAEFWIMTTAVGENKITVPLVLSGDGSGSYDTSPRGAIRLSHSVDFAGNITLAGNTRIAETYGSQTCTFSGDIITQGNTLEITGMTGYANTVVLSGNITSPNGNPGSIVLADNGTNNKTKLIIGDSTAAAEAVTQLISANLVNNSNQNPLVFATGANRTVNVQGKVTSLGKVIRKTGQGTVVFSNELAGNEKNALSGSLIVEQGTFKLAVLDSVGENNTLAVTVGNEAGTGTATLWLGQRALYQNMTDAVIYPNGTLVAGGEDISLAWGKTIEFRGGGTISSENNGFFNFRGGSQKLLVTGENADALISSNIRLFSGGTIDVQNPSSTLTLSGILNQYDNNSQIIKNGEGTLEITNSANSYTGGTTVNKGTLIVSGNGNLGTGAVTIAEDATLNLADRTAPLNISSLNSKGTIIGSGSIISSGTIDLSGDMILDITNKDTYDSIGLSTTPSIQNLTLTLTAGAGASIAFGDTFAIITSPEAFADGVLDEITFPAGNNSLLTYSTNAIWNYSVANLGTSGWAIQASATDRSSVPEPATWIMLILGTAGLVWIRRKKS